MGTTKKETRAAAIDRIVGREFAKGTALPAVRKILAATLGGAPNLYLGTADPRYYRLAGLATPLPPAPKSKPYATKDGLASASLARAIRVRRDSGVRWEVLAASVEAATGVRYSVGVVRALYEKGGGEIESSYVGRGTRIGAPATYDDGAAEARVGGTTDAPAEDAPAPVEEPATV